MTVRYGLILRNTHVLNSVVNRTVGHDNIQQPLWEDPLEPAQGKVTKDGAVLIRWELCKLRIWNTVIFPWLQRTVVFSLQQHCDTRLIIFNYPCATRVESNILFLLVLSRSSLWFGFPAVRQSSGLCRVQESVNKRHIKVNKRPCWLRGKSGFRSGWNCSAIKKKKSENTPNLGVKPQSVKITMFHLVSLLLTL